VTAKRLGKKPERGRDSATGGMRQSKSRTIIALESTDMSGKLEQIALDDVRRPL
jgi:hypothetical protein